MKEITLAEHSIKPGEFKDYELKGKVYNLDPPNGFGSDFGVALDLTPYLGVPLFGHSFIEGNVGSAQDVERERANHVSRINQSLGSEQRKCSNSEHCLSAIDQRDSFFSF